MTAKTGQQDDEPDEVAADHAEKAVELDLGDPEDFDGFEPENLSDEEKAQLAEASEKLAASLSRVMKPVRFEAGERLNEMVRRAAMPAALEANGTLNKFVGEAARPQVLRASERLGKLVSEAVMPQVMDTRKWSSVLSGFDTSVVAKSVLGSAGTSLRIAQLGTRSSLAEALGRSAAERASFSVTSGLKVSDSVTSMVSKALADSAGLGLGTRVNLLVGIDKKAGASVTDSISKVGLTAARVNPRVYEVDGFAMTLWIYYEVVASDHVSPAEYAGALYRLHAGMRSVEIATPHFMERVAQAERLVADRDETPAIAEADRDLLLRTLRSAHAEIHSRGAAEQLLHGEPHSGNVLGAQGGPLFIDFETCCRGPIEFDVAHVPDEVSARYPDVDQILLQECRRLVLAMVAAWRWDVRDEFPNGHQHGRDILTLLREGPPWPALGPLAAE